MGNNQRYGFSATIDSWVSNLSKTRRSSKQALSIFADIISVWLSLWGAYTLRHGVAFSDFTETLHLFMIMPGVSVIVMASLGIYRWVVRSSNRVLIYQIGKASVISAMVLVLVTYLFPPDRTNPRSIFILYGLLLSFCAVSTRIVWQALFDVGEKGEPLAIYGAGEAGATLVQLLNQGDEYRPVIMLDDSSALAGTTVGGVRVYNPNAVNLVETLDSVEVSRVVLAMPSLSTAEYAAKVSQLTEAGFTVQTIPTYAELVSGAAKMEHVRDISINDILGRSEVPPDPLLLGMTIVGKVVMVTGAGGSIGSELCRQIAMQGPSKLVALDQSEENLYKITEEINSHFSGELPGDSYFPVLCSVNDAAALHEVVSTNNIETIFHAAAYKHVPIVEAQPEQGVRVNVFGTLSLLDVAIANKVQNFVLISTDKAVRPTNAMGATKRTAEMVLQAKARMQKETTISMVRFGNVLGSSGSVVPKFKKQIEAGGPITLTDPDMTRYFMTIAEAAQLVLQAGSIAKGGDVFVLDMGSPVRIEDLAVSMVRMSGRQLKRDTGDNCDIEIEVSGLRPGEKMYEELFITSSHRSTIVPKVFTAEEAWMNWPELQKKLDALSILVSQADRPSLRARLLDLAFYGQALGSSLEPSLKIVEANASKPKKPASEEVSGSFSSVLP